SDDLLDGFDPAEQRIGESSGATNAAYASARPHTIPPSYTPVSDLNAPPVIVATEDTVPSAPPNMTVPVGHAQALGHTPQSGVPFIVGPPPASHPAGGRAPSGPQPIGAPISGPHPNAPPGYPGAPLMHGVPSARAVAQMTMRMPERPLNPRRGKTATLVVRPRGPSAKKQLIAFMAMLLLVTACGIAVIIWRKPTWIGLDPTVPLTPPSALTVGPSDPSGAAPPASAPAAVASAPHPAISASASAVASASASASAAPPRPKPRPPAPAASLLAPRQ
ncbi:MAG TPA: hypothetical protein VLT33_27040, partial [Labilithrix sp.]|nr:hypothetical protein [Labilithrix sp.]